MNIYPINIREYLYLDIYCQFYTHNFVKLSQIGHNS
jgi:hypothetical protein